MCHLFTHLVRNVIFIRKFCLCISHFFYSLLSKPRISTESTNWETRLKFTILAQLGRCSAKIQKPNSKPIFGIKSNALNLILCDEKNRQMNLQLDSPLTVFALLLSPLVYWWEIIKIFFSVSLTFSILLSLKFTKNVQFIRDTLAKRTNYEINSISLTEYLMIGFLNLLCVVRASRLIYGPGPMSPIRTEIQRYRWRIAHNRMYSVSGIECVINFVLLFVLFMFTVLNHVLKSTFPADRNEQSCSFQCVRKLRSLCQISICSSYIFERL